VAGAGGAGGGSSLPVVAGVASGAEAVQPESKAGRMSLGINLEFIRHADKSLEYGIKRAGFKGTLSVECGTEEQAVKSLAHLTTVFQELGV